MASYLGSTWESQATFLTDTEGSVDVSTQQPFSGTYAQVDPMGLFWSMVPPVDAELADTLPESATPLRVQFAEIAVHRLQRRGFGFPVKHLSYHGASHLVVTPPYLPTALNHARHPVAKLDFAFGGSPADEAFARSDSWARVVAFLRSR